jgi:hypothetical protein
MGFNGQEAEFAQIPEAVATLLSPCSPGVDYTPPPGNICR